MPSVASQHSPIASHQPLPSTRSHSEPDGRQPATPFAMLLDSVGPSADAAPAAAADRPARTERRDSAAANDQPDDANAPGKADADAKDVKETKSDGANATKDGTKDGTKGDAKDGIKNGVKNGTEAKGAKDAKAALHAKLLKLGDTKTDATVDADAVAKLDTDADASAAEVPAPAQPQAVPPAAINAALLAVPTTGAPAGASPDAPADVEAVAALQAAGKPAAAGDGKAASPADAKAPAAAAPDAPAGAVADKDAAAHAEADKVAGRFHLADDTLAKSGSDKPLQIQADTTGAAKASADLPQNLGLSVQQPAQSHATAAAAAAASPGPAQAAVAVPLAGLAVEIASQSHAGNKHFEIRLDPPELGRIDVKLSVDRDGHVTSRLIVDRAETLDLLKRDASELTRALQQAGLKTTDNGLEFSLRQQAFGRDDAQNQATAQLVVPDDDPAPLEALRQGYGRLLGLGGGLDIRV